MTAAEASLLKKLRVSKVKVVAWVILSLLMKVWGNRHNSMLQNQHSASFANLIKIF